MSEALEKIVEQIKALSGEERQEITLLLAEPSGQAATALEEIEWERRLAQEGFVALPSPPPAGAGVSLGRWHN